MTMPSLAQKVDMFERRLYRLLGEIEEANGEQSHGNMLEWLVRAAWQESRRELARVEATDA